MNILIHRVLLHKQLVFESFIMGLFSVQNANLEQVLDLPYLLL